MSSRRTNDATSMTTAARMTPMPGVYTTGAPPAATCFCSAMAMPKAWKAASATVAAISQGLTRGFQPTVGLGFVIVLAVAVVTAGGEVFSC